MVRTRNVSPATSAPTNTPWRLACSITTRERGARTLGGGETMVWATGTRGSVGTGRESPSGVQLSTFAGAFVRGDEPFPVGEVPSRDGPDTERIPVLTIERCLRCLC